MRIEHSRQGDLSVVSLEGEFDFHDVTQASEVIGAFIDEGARRLVFDLRALRFLSSGGIGYFIQTAKRLRNLGGELVLANSPESFDWVARTLGIDRVIRMFPDDQAAIAHLRDAGRAADLPAGPPA
ncbi:MAG TPA: STAS domain-containing protein [Planctomycetota bacterium]|nr:STAS domain-containing protein [Planctomycetota bacterium]